MIKILFRKIKSFFRRIKNAYLNIIYNHKYLRLVYHKKILKRYIANGIYVVGKNQYENYTKTNIRFEVEKLTFKKLFKPFIIIYSRRKKKIAEYDRADVYYRKQTGKMVFCFDDKVVSFYSNNTLCSRALKSIDLFLDKCNYPKCEYFLNDHNKRYNVCSFVKGESVSKKDIGTRVRVINKLLEYNKTAEKYFDAKYPDNISIGLKDYYPDVLRYLRGGYVQNGDLNASNIKCDGDDFTIIDFDGINIFPPFFDFFRAIGLNKALFGMFFDGVFDEGFAAVLSEFGEEFDETKKDKYLAVYSAAIYNSWTKKMCFELLPDGYVATKKVLMARHIDI